jgi:hypothetical protein
LDYYNAKNGVADTYTQERYGVAEFFDDEDYEYITDKEEK